MQVPVLICDPDEANAKNLKEFLSQQNYLVDTALDGKDCQLKVYKKKYKTLILDLDTQNHAGLIVLKYMRLNASSVQVILTVRNKKLLDELELTSKQLLQLGAAHVITKPYTPEQLVKTLENTNQFEEWKYLSPSSPSQTEEVVTAYDDEFTRIKIDDFYSGNATIFDHYVRLGKNKYVKILYKGERFDQKRLEKYIQQEKVTHLYFLTKERATYINFVNMVLEKLNKSPRPEVKRQVEAAKNLVEKYIEEVYVRGLHPQLLEEGKGICQGLFDTLNASPDLRELISRYEDFGPSAYSHHFLVSLFSVLICKQMDWATKRSVDLVSMGSMLHDIGKLKLPPEIRSLSPEEMTPAQLELYKEHPLHGNQMLQGHRDIPESVRQIVYQHHELSSGEGFPNGLTGVKIYPLAKIVGFSDCFAHFITHRKINPIKGLQLFLSERKYIRHYDPLVIKAFIKNFVKGKI